MRAKIEAVKHLKAVFLLKGEQCQRLNEMSNLIVMSYGLIRRMTQCCCLL